MFLPNTESRKQCCKPNQCAKTSERSSVRQKQIQLRSLSRFITARLFTQCCSCCWGGRSCGRFELFKTGVWCHCFSDSPDHSGSMFKFRRGISRLILSLIASCKSNLIRLTYKIMCYIWAFLSKHHPAAAHEMSPQRGRRVEVLERGTSRSQLSRLHLNAETFALFWLTAAKKKWICPLWFCGSLQRSCRETFHWTYSLIYWTMLTRDFASVGWEKTRQVTLCFLYVGERNELPDERLMNVSALPLKINCVFRPRQQIFPHKVPRSWNVTERLCWWILIASDDPAERTALRSGWRHPSSASPWWHIVSSPNLGRMAAP